MKKQKEAIKYSDCYENITCETCEKFIICDICKECKQKKTDISNRLDPYFLEMDEKKILKRICTACFSSRQEDI